VKWGSINSYAGPLTFRLVLIITIIIVEFLHYTLVSVLILGVGIAISQCYWIYDIGWLDDVHIFSSVTCFIYVCNLQ